MPLTNKYFVAPQRLLFIISRIIIKNNVLLLNKFVKHFKAKKIPYFINFSNKKNQQNMEHIKKNVVICDIYRFD